MSFFKKIADAFTSNESRFNTAFDKYLVSKLNNMAVVSITDFPKELEFKFHDIPNDMSLAKLKEYTCINLPELIEQIVCYGILFEVNTIEDYVKENVFRFHSDIKSIDDSFRYTKEQFFEIIQESARLFNQLYHSQNVLPSKGSLYNDSMNFEQDGKYDNIFKAFDLLLGHVSFISLAVFERSLEVISKFISQENLRNFKRFEDFSNLNLLKSIYDENLQKGLIPSDELNLLQNSILKLGVDSTEFTFEIYIDWLLLALVSNGCSIELAREKVANLKGELTKISDSWKENCKLVYIVSEFNSLPWIKRFGLMPETTITIYKLHYKKK
jgi:hypothetical protein